MTPRTFAPTLSGNPNQFTIDQHVFPRSAIARFVGHDGYVELQRLRVKGSRRKVPTADVFCAKRAWDQSTEGWKTRKYETSYQLLADTIAAGRIHHLNAEQDQIVSLFFALWTARHRARRNPTGDVEMRGVQPDRPITDEQAENLEANGYAFARGNVMPSHIMTSVRLNLQIGRTCLQLRGVHWGIVRSSYGEFVVPDNNDGFPCVPVTPRICLVAGAGDVEASAHDVASINFASVCTADEYYFARDLELCPVLRRTIQWHLGQRPIEGSSGKLELSN